MFNKKLLSLGLVAGLLVGTAQVATAADIDVDASIQTQAALSLTKNTDMDFGLVEFDAAHSGEIQLGTNGTVTLTGASGLTLGTAATTAGDVDVSGDAASVIEISCDAGGTLTDGGSNTLTLSDVEIAIDTGAAAGSGTACAGLTTVSTTVDLSSTATPKILMGGTLDVGADAIDGTFTYDTAAAGGDPVTLRVVYQ